jgi:hypothetical protein
MLKRASLALTEVLTTTFFCLNQNLQHCRITSGTNYKYPLSSGQAIWLRNKARGGKIVDYLTDEQRSYGDK